MEPSHARRYTKAEIEVIAAQILSKAYPTGINIPIEIDLLAERNELVDDIVPIELLEDKFGVAAVLISKSNEHFDIFVDEDQFNYRQPRASYSIAHELGHIVLHSGVCEGCRTIEDSIALRNRITGVYHSIERSANYFSGAILMPRRAFPEDTAKIYEALVREYSYDNNIIPDKLCSTLAQRYGVYIPPVKIRLRELNLQRKIETALRLSSPYLDP